MDLHNARRVGRGYCSDVYEWGEGRVLKLYHAHRPADRAERELDATRAVHAAGLPAPQALDLIDVEGRRGIVFERIDGPSVLDYCRMKPWKLSGLVRMLADLHVRINRCPAPDGLPSQREWVASRILSVTDMPEQVRRPALEQLLKLPDGDRVCHGDFHSGNVILTARGPVIIDWDTATRGHPLGDLACTSRLMLNAVLPPWSPFYMHWILRCTRPMIHRSYVHRYLRQTGGSQAELDLWAEPIAAAAKAWADPNSVAQSADLR